MNDARSEILARIRKANAVAGAKLPEVHRTYRRTGSLRRGGAEVLTLLRDRLVDYHASVLDGPREAVPQLVASALADVEGPVLRAPGVPDDFYAAGVPDDGQSAPDVLDLFAAVITTCAAACAETGTIALDAGAGQGRRAISLIPDLHVCIVFADQVVETVPELLSALDPSRPLTFISGPSATSDIELRRVEGVHGPRRLVVVLAR